jgi:hypothetical protein
LCADVKNNFLKIKNIILIYFRMKNILKNKYNYTLKQTLKLAFPCGVLSLVSLGRYEHGG